METPAKKRKGLLAFYISTGAACLLLVGFCFAWTPLRIRHYQRQLMEEYRGPFPPPAADLGEMDAAGKLVEIGPAAEAALERVLREGGPAARDAVLAALGKARAKWGLPLLVDYISRTPCTLRKSGGEGNWFGNQAASEVATALWAVEQISGRQFSGEWDHRLGGLPKARERLLSWWEKEGQARYGHGAPQLERRRATTGNTPPNPSRRVKSVLDGRVQSTQ